MGVVRGLIILGVSSGGSILLNKKNYNKFNKCNIKFLDYKINNFNYNKFYVNVICFCFFFLLFYIFVFNSFSKCVLKCFWYVVKFIFNVIYEY